MDVPWCATERLPMSARAVPCEGPAIKRTLVSGWGEPAGSSARANREGITQKSRCVKRGPCHERLRSHLLEARFSVLILPKSELDLLPPRNAAHPGMDLGSRQLKSRAQAAHGRVL